VRKAERQMNCDDTLKLLVSGEYGILSTVGKDGQPLGTPLSYIVKDNAVYFHCATEGQKLDNIINNSNVSFTVVGKTKVLQEKFSTEYESVIVSGKAHFVEGTEKIGALKEIIYKYSPNFIEEGMAYIERAAHKTCVVRIEILSLTGKHRT
jgi:uncharacterized protein